MLPLVTQAAAPAFVPAASRPTDPSRYFAPGQTLATRSGRREDGPDLFTAEETPILYLRVMPTRRVEPLKRAEAYDVIRKGPLHLTPSTTTAAAPASKPMSSAPSPSMPPTTTS
jgi:hypothetical protein